MVRRGGRDESEAHAGELVIQARAAKAELQGRGEALIAQAVALEERIAKSFWELGRVLMTMRDEAVHHALGFERIDDCIASRIGIAPTLAWKLITVAEQLPRAHAVKLGQEKAYALVELARVTPAIDSAAALVEADVEIGGKPVSQASLRELQAAAAAARPKRPITLDARKRALADRTLVKDLQRRLDGIGLPKRKVEIQGDEVTLRLTRRQVTRLLAGD